MMDIRINLDRLKKDIEELGQIGRDPNGGISRPSFSSADLEARAWLKDRIQNAGFQLREDGAGNIFGRLEGTGKTIMAGSHIDTVINGGMYDGSIGVLSALECLRRIKEEGVERTKPLEVASFTDEEGNLVGDYLGSRSFLASPSRELLEKGKTQFGIPFVEVLKNTEFSIDSIREAHKQRPEIEAFLEIHIEQGPVLETENKQIGIVEVIAGKKYWVCQFLGEASHAGTTPFELRHDALLGLADFALKSTQYVATHHYGSMLTIGRVQVHPGAFTIIPGEVDFSLDFRSTSKQTLEDLEKILVTMANDVASTRGLQFSSRVVDQVDPVFIPKAITNLMKEECDRLGYDSMMIPSGAGHDAQIIASVADIGMIFIPCEDGLSHSPKEKIQWDDLDRGANLLLQMILKIAQ
jgi:N-carbamoyl-L-amino-acid hydrolase